jgi:hypothetical protein
VQLSIDKISAHRLAIATGPQRAKLLIVSMPALGAWSMTGSKRGRLIEKEELRIRMRSHDDAVPPAELRAANQPTAHLGVSDDPLSVVM